MALVFPVFNLNHHNIATYFCNVKSQSVLVTATSKPERSSVRFTEKLLTSNRLRLLLSNDNYSRLHVGLLKLFSWFSSFTRYLTLFKHITLEKV